MKKLALIPGLLFCSLFSVAQSVAYKVNIPGAAIYETKEPPFKKIASPKRGETVLIVEDSGTAFKVQHNGQTGFISKSALVIADQYFDDPQNAWHSVATKKDNQIMASTSLSASDALKAIHQHLMENNFNIEKMDESSAYITATTPLTKGMGQGHVRINLFVKSEDSTRAYFQGAFTASVGGLMTPSMDLAGVVQKMGMKGSTMENAFNTLESVARSIPGAAIRYRKKPTN